MSIAGELLVTDNYSENKIFLSLSSGAQPGTNEVILRIWCWSVFAKIMKMSCEGTDGLCSDVVFQINVD